MDTRDIYSKRFDKKDNVMMNEVWKVLVSDFFQRFVDPKGTVLDVGAGFCWFINNVKAKRRIAFDANPQLREFASEGVEVVISDDLSLPMFRDGEFTHVFISNFLEHLENSEEVVNLFKTLRRKVCKGGFVLILQPNFRYVGADYFNFIDHRTVLTEKSIIEALEISGFSTEHVIKKFLPYTSKSRLPKHPSLIRLYLKIPSTWRILGKQSFVVARVFEGQG